MGPGSWTIGLVLTAAGLLGLFSLGGLKAPPDRAWFSVESGEWNFYKRLFDRRPSAVPRSAVPVIAIAVENGSIECDDRRKGGAWTRRQVTIDGKLETMEIRNARGRPGLVIRPEDGSDGPRFELMPATAAHVRSRRANALARDLGLIVPEMRLMRLRFCDRDMGHHILMDRVDGHFTRARNARSVRMGMDPSRPDLQFPLVRADSAEAAELRGLLIRAMEEVAEGRTEFLLRIMDLDAVAAWALMAWVDHRDLREGAVEFAYDMSNGRFSPIYRSPLEQAYVVEGNAILLNPITPLLELAAVRDRVKGLQERVREEWTAWQQREAGATALWSAVLGLPAQPFPTLEHITDQAALEHFKFEMRRGPGQVTLMHGIPLPTVARESMDPSLLQRLTSGLRVVVKGDSIIFPRGKYVIEEDIEFPAGHTVVFLQGARVFLGPGVSMWVKGDLFVRGTLRNPVFIRPLDRDRPFGAVAVLGGLDQQCGINGLYLSGGAGSVVGGLTCEGMLSIQSTRTRIASSVFQANEAEASVAVQGGELWVDGVRWEGASGTFLLLERTRATIRDPLMLGSTRAGAVGLIARDAQVSVQGGAITRLTGRGLSAEVTARVLVRGVRFSGNAIAVRSVDEATVFLEGNVFDANAEVLSVDHGRSGERIILFPNRWVGAQDHPVMDGIVEKPEWDEGELIDSNIPPPMASAP